MRQRFHQFALLLFTLLIGIPLGAWADREVNQLQFGKQVITVASDEVITFYDPWGTENIVDNNSYNAQSLTVFKPAEEGKSVQVTFETLDLNQYSSSYFLYLNIYDGVADADNAFAFASSTSGVTGSSNLSGISGTLLAEEINNDNKPALPAVYTSGTSDGALSVGFMHRNSNKCTGWVAKVKVVTLENMTVTGAGSSYDTVESSPTSKLSVPLAQAFVTATGIMNPDNVTAIHFSLLQNEGMVDPASLRLMKGDKQVETTVETDGTGYKFSLSESPSDGTTIFTIVGDILSTAEVGAKVQVDINKIATVAQPEGIAPFKAATSVVVTNPALVLMSSQAQTVTVGNTPLAFFDEGGANSGIQANTNGTVIFVPATEDSKVRIEFTKNAIWHGSYYNQELRIYNGTEIKEENLLKTLQQGETATISSTAADGALTVQLFSDASTTQAVDGFEATVSLFVPQAMDFNSITATPYTEGTVCAGDTEQRILDFVVNTKDTEPAMQATKFSFTTNGSNELVTKATLYYTVRSNEFSSLRTYQIGTADITADAFEIIPDAPVNLIEGDNYFWLTYDINDDVLNGQKISAMLSSVTANVDGQSKTEPVVSGITNDGRTVENIVLSHKDQGTVTKTVNGSLAFNTQTTSSYSSYCEAGTDDRINIFVPKHEGMVCEIDFSEFNVQYSSSSYGSKSKFRIYAGQGTTGELLWELDSYDYQSTGPGQIIRSNAPDGALTVVFNPNSSYSYYYKGFKATVSEYQTKDMEIVAVEAEQTTTADASIGATEQELLTVNVQAEGAMNALTISALTLNLKGTEANINKVSVWQGETKLTEAEAATEVTLTLNEPTTLTEGNNLFTVKVDISTDAEENQTIDASLVSVVVGENTIAATTGDPEGSRTLKNMVLMTTGNHGTLNLPLGKTVDIYDDGGADDDGADGVEATLTLAPTGEADCIRLTNQGITFSYTAHLYIYKGATVDADNLIVDLSGSSAKFDPIVSDADVDGGQLTIRYVGAGSYTKPNFAIQAEGYKKTALTVNSITTEDISVSEVLKGQTEVKMLKVAVEVKGDLGSVDITAFNVTNTNGVAVEAQHIYPTGKYATFSANETFNENYSITGEGTYYFWICYDIKADAEVGQTADAVLTGIVANGETIGVSEPATATITVATGKSGTYTVGEGGTYATIQGAIDDLGTLGMEGPVTLNIKAGEYNEKVRIPYIKGMGAQNTLTLESESGERDVKIYHNQYTTAGYSDDQHKKDYGVVTLYEASYVTLRNLEITTTDATGYKALVMVKDGSRHNTIDNCYLHADIIYATSGDGVALVHHTIIDEENKNNDYLTVKNSLLEGGKYGVYMGGTSYTSLPKEVGGVVEGNTFKNNGRFMMYAYDELGAKIRNNTFIIDDNNVKMSNGVIDINVRDEYAESTEITGNVFNIASANTVSVIYVRQMEATAEAPAIIANNVVNLASANASCTPIKFSSNKAKNMNIAHNTFRMTGTNGGAAFWASSALADGYGNVNVVNNIIQNETNGYAVNLYNDANLASEKFSFQNNVLYTAGETFFRASSGTTGDFATFVEKTGATGSLNNQVAFVSDDILEPDNDLDGDLLTAQPLSYVTTDITGKTRSATPTIGAYEYSNQNVAPVMADGYPTTTTLTDTSVSIALKTDNNGTAYVLVQKKDAEAPTADAVVANGVKATLNQDAETLVSIEELDAETDYVAYIVTQATRGAIGELTSLAFTTPETPADPPIATLYADEEEELITVAENAEVELQLMLALGKAPYQVVWTSSKSSEPLKTETLDEMPIDLVTLDIVATTTADYMVSITDAQDNTVSDSIRVVVTGEAQTATFDDLRYGSDEDGEYTYEYGPFWQTTVSKYWGQDNYTGSFTSGSYAFRNSCIPTYGSFEGFAYSKSTATGFSSYATDQFNAITGQGYDGSESFAVSFGNSEIEVLNNASGDELRGFYITNSAWNAHAYLNGTGMSDETDEDGVACATNEGFRKGDYCKLTITADNGNQLEYYLADYRSDKSDDHYYIKEWEWVDLSTLGTVKKLSFSVSGSRKNQWGPTLPAYFCMDNFNGERQETDGATLNCGVGTSTTDATSLFTLPEGNATTTYEVVENTSAKDAVVTIDDEGKLTVSTTAEESFDIVVKATKQGHSEYVRIPVSVLTTIRAIDADGNTTELRYDASGRRVANPVRGLNIVRKADGTTQKVARK